MTLMKFALVLVKIVWLADVDQPYVTTQAVTSQEQCETLGTAWLNSVTKVENSNQDFVGVEAATYSCTPETAGGYNA